MAGGTNTMRRAAIAAADAALVLAGALAVQVVMGLAWGDLSDAQRGAIALLCALTVALLPRSVRVSRGAASSHDGGTELTRTLVAVVCASTLTVGGTMWIANRGGTVTTRWIARTVLSGDAALLLGRLALGALAMKRGDARARQRRVAIVGATAYGRVAIDRMQLEPAGPFAAACVFDDDAPAVAAADGIGGVPVIGDWVALRRMIRGGEIDEVWLTLPMSHESRIQRIVRELRDEFVELRLLPDVRQMAVVERSATDVLGMPAINLATTPRSAPELWAKFAFDRLFAIAVLIPLLPLLAVLAIAVKLSSPGPVLFRQRRKGADGREFHILKFRTMRVHRAQPGVVRQASRNDARITPVGAFLRRTSLDELPQFFNVLFGQMSVVGPRPHAIEHDDFYRQLVDCYMYRYRVRPGITGWAQVNGYRGETRKVEAMAARVKFDLFYMQNWSFWFDMKIILMTVVRGFVGRNAF
ncbi:undecaprenyl-phosphate glucose phosphotransferase [Burkholderia diffusa]|uniref:Undecaprenyl-phosphate glucose phosphotransferase n=1 Tax=Burkholderia diffusa TaxID=488732 RepID=A0AAW3PFH1_9BURK|nr:undecaprenyl-phosphate glucose phosphotransferase [Burkholderia diffusa]KUZ11701.1 undecaprenyl-phosphate glucose phosphotransferase [Burkholderia diffusa]KVC17856.1 undecaprenyl-phosphate glucose phosphotransferase [Burkholderia diffusa]KWF32428.1 undecaprenyl-phosphate glucose phosphotransferase [Burkholderia diffusa]KWF35262.1 undecaprenyl-phosphate glucose phosphotransferase [Burkholderia diffusa]KWF49276.1 undecaprenyl-phosphate glucose phosphotransferase [Burkholderia diffusa]